MINIWFIIKCNNIKYGELKLKWIKSNQINTALADELINEVVGGSALSWIKENGSIAMARAKNNLKIVIPVALTATVVIAGIILNKTNYNFMTNGQLQRRVEAIDAATDDDEEKEVTWGNRSDAIEYLRSEDAK